MPHKAGPRIGFVWDANGVPRGPFTNPHARGWITDAGYPGQATSAFPTRTEAQLATAALDATRQRGHWVGTSPADRELPAEDVRLCWLALALAILHGDEAGRVGQRIHAVIRD